MGFIAPIVGGLVGEAVGGGVLGAVAGGLASEVVGGAMGGGGGGSGGGAAGVGGGVAGALLSAGQANEARAAGVRGAQLADPFAAERPFYQDTLRKLFTDPSSITSTPLYQARMASGVEAVNRGTAARGQLNSGARLAELTGLGQNLAQESFNSLVPALSNLAMSGSSPAAAGQLLFQGVNAAQGRQGEAATQGMYALEQASRSFGGSGGTQPSATYSQDNYGFNGPLYNQSIDFEQPIDYSLGGGASYNWGAPTYAPSYGNYDFNSAPNWSLT